MDLSSYANKSFIKVNDLANGSQRKTIAGIEEGQYGKPVVTFTDRSRLSLNGTNVNTIINAFGSTESEDLIGEEIELFVGTIRYQGNDTPSVLVRALCTTSKKPRPEFNDDVPF